MRIPAIAAAAAAAATASLLFMAPIAPAHAAAAAAADGPGPLPAYNCASVIALRNYPPTVIGNDCQAANGAPAQGPVRGPFLIASPDPDTQGWICEAGDAGNYPARVIGQVCVPR